MGKLCGEDPNILFAYIEIQSPLCKPSKQPDLLPELYLWAVFFTTEHLSSAKQAKNALCEIYYEALITTYKDDITYWENLV